MGPVRLHVALPLIYVIVRHAHLYVVAPHRM